jgi:hypothetical protein
MAMVGDAQRLAKSRDLSVPDWGPYSKLFAGVSHLARARRTSVDFLFALKADGADAVLPEFAGRCSRFHEWGASAGLRHFSYKFDLDGLAGLTAVADFWPSARGCAAELTLTNRTRSGRQAEVEILAVIPPELKRPPELRLRHGEHWTGAEAYVELETWAARSDDGYRNLVKADADAVDGVCVSRGWAMLPGTRIAWRVKLNNRLEGASLGLRYLKSGAEALRYALTWDGRRFPLVFPVGPEYQWLWVPVGDVGPGLHEFSMAVDPRSRSGAARDLYGQVPANIQLDGFLLTSEPRADAVVKADVGAPPEVRREQGGAGWFALAAAGSPLAYTVGGEGLAAAECPLLFAGPEVEKALAGATRLGCWRLADLRVAGGEKRRVRLGLACGPDMPAALKRARDIAPPAEAAAPAAEAPARFPTAWGVLSANCLMNVSYPVFLSGEVISTYTPGKTFGGLYSWDAGMHGIGLLELDTKAAVECLNTYLCGPDAPVDFIWHGTPLPVQAYLMNEIWLATGDRDLLSYFYPRLRRLYDYLLGHTKGSPTNRFGNGLLNTYPIFYNAGGWDDLPPQVAVHTRGLEDEITPVCSTAHAVRFSRFMQRFAEALGRGRDLAAYEADIRRSLEAIARTWDPMEQVYSYVRHATFAPFRHEDGANFNHTLDGLTPLIGGGIESRRAGVLIERLAAAGRFWSDVGISTVDQSAPYYSPDGYWNGCVWVPHQWFLWKAMLDWGHADLARRIPRQAAEVWERESRRTHCSFEFFRISTGQGDGYPHFAGLSSPALAMMNALSKPGRLTVGFDAEIRNLRLTRDTMTFEARSQEPDRKAVALAVPPRPGRCQIEHGREVEVAETDDLGCFVFRMPRGADWTKVTIRPCTGRV